MQVNVVDVAVHACDEKTVFRALPVVRSVLGSGWAGGFGSHLLPAGQLSPGCSRHPSPVLGGLPSRAAPVTKVSLQGSITCHWSSSCFRGRKHTGLL